MIIQKMFRQNLFLCANKFRLSKFSVKPSLSTRTTVLCLKAYTTAIDSSSQPVTGPDLQNLRESKIPHIMQYFLDNSHKYSVVNTDQINVDDETNFQSLKLLKAFMDNPEETEISDDLLDSLKEEFEKCGIDEIYKFIKLFANYDYSERISKPLNLFNEELLKRNFSDDDTLKILWVIKESLLKSNKKINFKYYFKSTIKLCFKIHRLNSQQIAQLFLHLRERSTEFQKKVKFPMQIKLIQTIPELNAEEFTVLADGFLKSTIPFTHPELPGVIMNKAIKEIENMSEIYVFKVCRLLENNLRYANKANLVDFQDQLLPHISNFSARALIHLVLTGAQLKWVHKSLWEFAADIFKKNMDSLEVKDIDKLLYATTIYNIHDEELLSLAIKHLKEKAEVNKYSHLISSLHHLAHHKLYPEDLLGLVLSENFLSQFNPDLFGVNLKYKYSCLSCCVEIDKPEYNLHFLDEDWRKRLFKAIAIVSMNSEALRRCTASLKRMMSSLENLYGENTVCEANCLPHYGRGIVMEFDKMFKAQKFQTKFRKYFYAKEAINDKNLFSLFIQVVPMSYFLEGEDTLILPAQTMVRQLKDLGYKPIVIKNIEWLHHLREGNELNFIKNLIQKNLEDLL